MDAKTKKYLIIGGVTTVVVALAGFGVHKFIKNRKNRTTSGKQKEREEQKLIGKKVHYGSEGYVNVRSSAKLPYFIALNIREIRERLSALPASSKAE